MPKETGMQNGRQMRFSETELSLLRNTFKGNDELLKLLRKMFLPELDPSSPPGQMVDLWMSLDIKDKSLEDIAVNLIARNQLISHVDTRLIEISVLCEMNDETAEESLMRLKKNSSK